VGCAPFVVVGCVATVATAVLVGVETNPALAVAMTLVGSFWLLVLAGLARRFVICSFLTVDGRRRVVERQWKIFGIPLSERRVVPELAPERVSEVHFLRYTLLGNSIEQLYVVDEAGERHPVYMRAQAAPWQRLDPDKLEAAADGLGNVVDAPVRTFHGLAGQQRWSTTVQVLQAVGLVAREPEHQERALPAALPSPKKKGLVEAPRCPACQGILSRPVIECTLCKVVVHERCWEAARGCPLEGCEGRRGDPPAPLPSLTDDFTLVEARNPYAMMSPTMLAATAILVVLTALMPFIGMGAGGAMALVGGLAGLGVMGFFAYMSFHILRQLFVRTQYRFSPRTGTVERTYTFLSVPFYSSLLPDVTPDDVVEVYYEVHPGRLMQTEELSVGLRDGRRLVVYRSIPPTTIVDFFSSPTMTSDEVAAHAERLAAFGHCTVRLIRSERELPSALELRQLGEATNPGTTRTA